MIYDSWRLNWNVPLILALGVCFCISASVGVSSARCSRWTKITFCCNMHVAHALKWFRFNSLTRVVLFQIAPHIFVYTYLSLSLSAFCFQDERISFTRWHLYTTYTGSKYLLFLTTDVPNGHSLNDYIRTKCIMKHHEGACIYLLWRLHHQKQYEYIYFN